MTLLENKMTDCAIMEKIREPDGFGGVVTVWSEGMMFRAAIVYNNSIQARMAQAQGVTGIYDVITNKSIILEYHDVIKRLSDGKILRITSDGHDNATPDTANLNMRQVSAEEWKLS